MLVGCDRLVLSVRVEPGSRGGWVSLDVDVSGWVLHGGKIRAQARSGCGKRTVEEDELSRSEVLLMQA